MRAPTVVLLVRDEALRDTIATILGDLTRMFVTVVESVESARTTVRANPSAVFIVAPAWGDVAVASLLSELRSTDSPIVIVSASPEHALLAVGDAVFVRAPFDVDTLFDAIEAALGSYRGSRTQRVAH